MIKSQEVVRRVLEMVLCKQLTVSEASELLESSVRTVFTYIKRYQHKGPAGLVDRRHGNHHKLTPEMEKQIIEYKLQKPQRSACWIRNRLKLDVTVECIRMVLVKHGLNHNRTKNRHEASPMASANSLIDSQRCKFL
jgi:transposase